MKRWQALLAWMAFVVVATVTARTLFGDRARLGSTGYVVTGVIAFVVFFTIFYRQVRKRQGPP